MDINSQSSRSEAHIPRNRALIQDVYYYLSNNLFIAQMASVKSYDADNRIATCTIDRPNFANLEIEAPLIQNLFNPNLEEGQKVLLIQATTDPQNPEATNYFDRGNWWVLSVFDLKQVDIKIETINLNIKNLDVAIESGGSVTVGGDSGIKVDESGVVIGGDSGVKVSSSGVSIEGKSWATHTHQAGTLVAPNGAVSGATGVPN